MSTEERIQETFVVGETPRFSVSNVRGSINVRSDERNDIQVTAVKQLKGCNKPKRTEIHMRQEGDHVVVKTHYRGKKKWLKRSRGARICAVDYTVLVPTHCDIDVSQVKGTVHVSGVTGRVKVDAVQGAVELCEIAGRTQVKAVSATVDGDKWSGQAQVNSVSGPVQITAAQLSRVKADIVSGDLTLETAIDDQGRYDFNSVSGDVTFFIPPEQGVESRGTTISGHLVCDLPHQFSHCSRSGWRVSINGGGPALRFNSISGDLEVLAVKPYRPGTRQI